jgi:hypothetical protein
LFLLKEGKEKEKKFKDRRIEQTNDKIERRRKVQTVKER